MCGILGIVVPPGRSIELSESQLRTLRDVMADRGPDGAGLLLRRHVALAHRRLAIRDLEGGAQPWLSADQQTALIYNGELYNDAELRGQLRAAGHSFHSRCDTETVLAAYRHWGVECVKHLRGMFAFAIYDFRDESLLLARDRFGIKPLFLAEMDGGVLFASSISSILAHPRFVKQPNMAALSHYLSTFRLTLGRETVYRGIWQLMPGELLCFRDGEHAITRYWDYPHEEDEAIEYEDALSELDELLDEAVRVRLASDVPVGMFLSGGVDSNTIACLARKYHGRPMLGQCGGGDTGGTADFDFAARAARHSGFEYDELRVGAQTYRDRWIELIERYRTPLATPSDVILYSLAVQMKKSVGVVLGGEGADELLCGYAVQHWAGHDFEGRRAIDCGKWDYGEQAARRFLGGLRRQYGSDSFGSATDHFLTLNSLVPAQAKAALFQPWAWEAAEQDQRVLSYYQRLFEECGDMATARKHMRILHRVNLESLLGRLDSSTMQAGLEARVPFTDHQLVERMFRVPDRFKIAVAAHEPAPYLASAELATRGSLCSKRLLRSLAERLMPAELAFRKKASFPTPVQTWLAGPWREWAGQRLRESPFAQAVFQPAALGQLADQVPQAGMWLWPLLNFAVWGDREFAGC